MNINRLIPCLTILDGKLIKTKNFDLRDCFYIGDVINAVRIFNEKKVEELIIQDIGATIRGCEPDYNLINKISSITRMPITYGGGIKNISQARKIISLGVEKISISSAAIDNPKFIFDLSNEFGNQSISLTLDVKKINNDHKVFTHNANRNTYLSPLQVYKSCENFIGEIVINSIDKDGTMLGPDYEVLENLYDKLKVPMIIMGGIGNIEDIKNIYNRYSVIGISCGSLFLFKGSNRAVLINYPKENIFDII